MKKRIMLFINKLRASFIFFLLPGFVVLNFSQGASSSFFDKVKCSDIFSRTSLNDSLEKQIVERFYLAKPHSKSHVSYQISFEKLEYYLLNLSQTHKNQLKVSDIGKYDGEFIRRIDISGWGKNKKKRVIISAGVHGNESAGVGTVINIIERIMYDSNIRNNFDIVIIPYMNPGGLLRNQRRLNNGLDLNRAFTGESSRSAITKMILKSLDGEYFDLALDLHEASFRHQFFVIKTYYNDNQLTKNVLRSIPKYLLATSEDGKYPGFMYKQAPPGSRHYPKSPEHVSYTLQSPGEALSNNFGTLKGFFAKKLKSEYAYTIEAPGQFSLDSKIKVQSDIVQGYLEFFLKLSHTPW